MHYGKVYFINQEHLKRELPLGRAERKKQQRSQRTKYFHINLVIYKAQNTNDP